MGTASRPAARRWRRNLASRFRRSRGWRRRSPPGDEGYVTVQDASRPAVMYNLQDADSRVVALDISTKETNTPGVTAHLRVPLLIVNGMKDRLACAADATDCSSAATLEAAEQPFYPESRVDAVVVPRAGHAVNLHRNADFAYQRVIAWTTGTSKPPHS